MDRRGFLVRTGLTFAAGALATWQEAAGAEPSRGDLVAAERALTRPAAGLSQGERLEEGWDAVRGLFSLSPEYLHFGGLYLASHPAPVQQAIDTYRRGLDDNPVDYLHTEGPRLEAAVLRSAARYLGADPTDIALTDSTTMGLGLLYTGIELRPDQEILTTQHDFYATHEALRYAAARDGASLRMVPLYRRIETVSADEIVDSVAQALGPRTRILAVTWVHSSTGLKLPIRRIADVLAEVNADHAPAERVLLCVDGVHGLGVEDAQVASLGADFFVSGAHKWLLGPRGTGFVWGRGQAAWAVARPTIPTFSDRRVPGGLMTPGGFHSFEHRWALSAAFDLHEQIGRSRVAARIHGLNRQLKDGLASLRGVRLYTPLDEELSAGLVCFEVDGLSPESVVEQLHSRKIIATVTPYARAFARLAAGLVNTPEQVDSVVDAVRAIAT
jgi:selenocysteine lyase/cysteine desulfurase